MSDFFFISKISHGVLTYVHILDMERSFFRMMPVKDSDEVFIYEGYELRERFVAIFSMGAALTP